MSISMVLGDLLSLSCHAVVLPLLGRISKWNGKVGGDVLLWSWSDENIYYSLMSQCGGSRKQVIWQLDFNLCRFVEVWRGFFFYCTMTSCMSFDQRFDSSFHKYYWLTNIKLLWLIHQRKGESLALLISTLITRNVWFRQGVSARQYLFWNVLVLCFGD